MRRISLVAVIVTLCASLWAAHKVTPLNIKTGLWQMTTTTMPGEDVMLPAALLEKLTSEQRDRVEERLKARQAELQKTTIAKQCLTRRELERGVPFLPARKSCIWTVIDSASSKVEMLGHCVDHSVKTEETLRIEALSPEEAAGSVQFSPKGKDATPQLTSIFKAKWIGQVCRAR